MTLPIPPEAIGAISAFAGGLAGGWIAGSRKVKKAVAKISADLGASLVKIAREAAVDAITEHERQEAYRRLH